MLSVLGQEYVGLLRLKEGEYRGLTELRADIARRFLPHFVVMPPSEPDPEKGRSLLPEELIPEGGQRVGRHWPMRTCLLDPRFLFSKLGEDKSVTWLPQLFKASELAGGRAIPVATLEDLEGTRVASFREVSQGGSIGLALRLLLRDFGSPNLRTRVKSALARAETRSQDCILIIDFSSADFSEPSSVAEYIPIVYQQVAEIALWGKIVVQGASYPEKNPADPGSEVLCPRGEWIAWSEAAKVDDSIRSNLAFGDFCADSAKFSFKGGRAPIRHYRYTTPNAWYVVRGADESKLGDAMHSVSNRIIRSKHFAGPGFSRGDLFIYNTARDRGGPGAASTWRKVNTIHHITRVITDLGPYRGYQITSQEYAEPPTQRSFL